MAHLGATIAYSFSFAQLRLERHAGALVLGVILIFAFSIRLIGINFGLPIQLNPDEWSQVDIARQMLHSADLNSHFFRYGSLMVDQLLALDGAAQLLWRVPHPPSDYFLIGRLLSAAYGTATVWAIYLFGRQLNDKLLGLVAALLVAVAPELVRESHYATVDVAMTFWIVVTLVLLLGIVQQPQSSVIPVGIVLGLAVSTKYAALLVLPLPLLAVIWRNWHSNVPAWDVVTRHRVALVLTAVAIALLYLVFLLPTRQILELARSWTTDGTLKPEYLNLFTLLVRVLWAGGVGLVLLGVGTWWSARVARLVRVLIHPQLLLFFGTILGAFFLTSPFVVLDLGHAAPDILYEYRHVLIGAAAQYTSSDPRSNVVHVSNGLNQLRFYWQWWIGQNGWLVTATALGGGIVLLRRHPAAFYLTAVLLLVLGVTLARAGDLAERYALPVVPVLALWTAAGSCTLLRKLNWLRQSPARGLVLAALLAVPLTSAAGTLYNQFILVDTRSETYQWLMQNAPAGARVVRESYTPDLEHATDRFITIPVIGAFDTHTLADWQDQKVDYILIGIMEKRYRASGTLYANRLANYELLEHSGHLVRQFKADSSSTGPTVSIYQLK